MHEIAPTIDAGNRFYEAVMRLDQQKRQHSVAEVEALTTTLASAFVADAASPLKPRIRFCDLEALMKFPAHKQLCFVEIDGPSCRLNFHQDLLASSDVHRGLIYVANSWPLLVLLATLCARELAFAESFVFEIGDNGVLDSVAFCSNNSRACLILDHDFLRHAGYQEFREDCARHPLAWSDREDKVFWRGASTGHRSNEPREKDEDDDLSWLQRLRLCVAANDPAVVGRCDIGLSNIVQIPQPHLQNRVVKAGLVKGFAPREKFAKQKFVVDVDGNSNAWSGLFLALYGGSCVLKVESFGGYRQWYYDGLTPWYNYVPLKKDLADFAEKVDWVQRNDREAEEIGKRGQELARQITLESAIDVSARNLAAWLARQSAASSLQSL